MVAQLKQERKVVGLHQSFATNQATDTSAPSHPPEQQKPAPISKRFNRCRCLPDRLQPTETDGRIWATFFAF